MNSKISKSLLLFILCIAVTVFAESGDKKGQNNLNKTQGEPVKAFLNINSISTQIYNDGNSDIDPSGNSGVVYPKGSGKTAVFESGFLWGAKVPGDPQVRVGGSVYRQGLQPGKILSPGVAESPDLPKNRIYRVRPDIFPGGPTVDLTSAATDEGSTSADVRAQYELDWTEWPATDGAPYRDGNLNGVYDPVPVFLAGTTELDTLSDIPGVTGADQTIWFVANDLDASKTEFMYGAQPLGIEQQATIWAYSQTGALGSMFFRRYKIINKSNTSFDSMYVSMWSDVDLGNSVDDYAGCDTALSLGYCYNANASDATYQPLPPPAVGFDFFQGPQINDTTFLPMTAFYYFARGDNSVVDPTQGALSGSNQFYNFMRGRIGLTGIPFTNPLTNQPTPFALDGDPVKRTGWIDGMLLPAGDRRIGMASGPFQMAVGDTQEVVVAEIIAGAIPGMDRLSAIGLLKFFDEQAQLAYDSDFNLPVAPPRPEVNIVELNKEIVLDWGSNLNRVNQTESSNAKGYTFEGYNVYQLPSASASVSEGRRIATFDIVNGIGKIEDRFYDTETGVVAVGVKQFGNDTGIKRYLSIKNDEIKGGTPLINGIRYYFAVTAYSYNPDVPVLTNLENPIATFTVIPHEANPGVFYNAIVGDTIEATHSAGISEGLTLPIIVDPSKLNGHSYRVNFDTVTVYPGTDSAFVQTSWRLTDVTDNTVLFSNQLNQTGDDNYLGVAGMIVKVTGPPSPGMKDFEIPNGERRWTFANADGFGLEGFSAAIGNAYANWFSSSTVGFDQLKNVLIKFADADTGGVVADPNDPNVSYAYRYLRGATGAPARPEFAPFIVNATAGYAYQDYIKNVYFSAWDMEANPPRRLAIGHLENNVEGGRVDGLYNPPTNNDGIDNVAGTGPREWFFIFDTDYTDATPDPVLTVDILNTTTPMMWMGTVNRRGDASYHAGDEFLILANHLNLASDEFTFTAPLPGYSVENAKVDINKINVFPNPYYGVNSEELNKYNRFVTFTHLPAQAKIRIFNLAGVLVKTIDKNDPSQFQRWDLANQSGLPVASGLYIAYIDMPELGSTKIVKVAIIQEQQILDRF